MRNGRVLVLASLCACAGGVDMGEDSFGFGPPAVGSATATGGDEDTDGDDDDDGFASTGAGELETSGGHEPDPSTTSGALPPETSGPPATSGPPMVTTDPPDPGESSGFPDGTTGTLFPETTGVPGGGGQLGDPCLGNADCVSGICVDTGFTTYCSEQCTTEADCPPGWFCVETTTPGLSVCF